MKVKIFIFFIFTLFSTYLFAQKGTVKGVVKDASTGETLIGANILYAPSKGTTTDINGNYSISIDNGDYNINVSYIGYKTITKKIKISDNTVIANFNLKTITLTEVDVVADIAKTRETPVAFTTVLPAKIDEELASQDIPMILNTTPGVYATQQGGGDGDSRINIRGFNQRNLAVMLDGIPVNDMENGWVYWSNWFGLDAVTRSIQVQRGLGASKLAIPSVGGTMNIITKGIENKKKITVKQEVGSNGFLRTSLGLTTGKLKNDWSVTFAGSYKRGNGWVDQTYTRGYFYFLKIDKKLKKHLISISAMGAPQKHAQRSYKKSIANFDKKYAANLGVDTTGLIDRGIKYNQHWGYIERYKMENTDTIHAEKKELSERLNYYYKPVFSLRDFWNVNDKLYISNIAYLSIGNGGGTGAKNSITDASLDKDGQIDFQKFYDANAYGPYSIDASISPSEHKSSQYLRTSINNHFWYGFLSTANYKINKNFDFSGGVDIRSYKGEHYREVYDLLGGDYAVDENDKNQESKVKREGDKISYHNDGLVRWGGIFTQTKYKNGNLSAFVNLTTAYSGYKRIDYFLKKQLSVEDTILEIGYNDAILYKGNTYTRNSSGLKKNSTKWKWLPGFTAKGGLNYNISKGSNVFVNLGYLSVAPKFNTVYDKNNTLFRDLKNEKIKGLELGYSYYSPKITLNVNGYITEWENKPSDFPVTITIDEEPYSVNINGMNAFHKGVEIEFAHKLGDNVIWQRLLSVGNWLWTSEDSLRIYDDNQNLVKIQYFNAKGVHVGDAAQFQYRESIRWEIIKGLYINGGVTYFSNYYADFDPITLDGTSNSLDADGNSKDSWKIPNYFLVDLHAGYHIKFKKIKIDIRASILNALDKEYISDARNNDQYTGQTTDSFDAQSAAVFFGLGRRFNTSVKFTF